MSPDQSVSGRSPDHLSRVDTDIGFGLANLARTTNGFAQGLCPEIKPKEGCDMLSEKLTAEVSSPGHGLRIAAIIACYNEELTIEKVIKDMMQTIPGIEVYVYDNNSTDRTPWIANKAGAHVRKEKKQGKGHVVQAMFSQVDADIYIMVDGDDTYDLSSLPMMVSMVAEDHADVVIGSRHTSYDDKKAFKPLHTFGNSLVNNLVNYFFDANLKDVMSGLRVMNRSFVKNINPTSPEYEIETELSVKARKLSFVVKEINIDYRERPLGSFSKLNTFRDGFKVLKTIFVVIKNYRPMLFFSCFAFLVFMTGLLAGGVVLDEFARTSYIKHVPLAILSSGCMLMSMISLATGVILDSTNHRFDELHTYLRGVKNNG